MIAAILFLLNASLIGQEKAESAPAALFTSKSAGFSVAFPGSPTESFLTEKTVAGPRIHKVFEFAEVGKSRRVICADLSKERLPRLHQEAIDGIADFYAKASTFKILARKNTTFQGEPALEVDLEQGKGITHKLYLIKNKHLYQITLYFANRDDDDPAEFKRYVDSFRAFPPVGNLTDGMDSLTSWKEFHSAEEHYRIKVIGEPPRRSMSRQTPAGPVEVNTIRFLGPKGENYGVFVTTLGRNEQRQEPVELYETIMNGAAEQLKGKVESKKSIERQGRLGLEYIVALPDKLPFADGVYKTHLFRIGEQLFQIIYVGPRARMNTKETIDFFDSFLVDREILDAVPVEK